MITSAVLSKNARKLNLLQAKKSILISEYDKDQSQSNQEPQSAMIKLNNSSQKEKEKNQESMKDEENQIKKKGDIKDVSIQHYSTITNDQQTKFGTFKVHGKELSYFEYFIILSIIANSVVLSMYDYSDRDANFQYNQILDLIQISFTVIFTLECLFKIISMGFFMNKNSYLRDGWNVIDFVVVLFGFIDFLPVNANLKSLRTLRVLRPLRSINAIKRMRNLVNTLLRAIPDFGNVAIFLVFIFLLFGVIGIHQYDETIYFRCRLTPAPILDHDSNKLTWPRDPNNIRICAPDYSFGLFTCPSGSYCGAPHQYGISLEDDGVYDDSYINYGITSFNQIGLALLTEFQILTNDNWAATLYNYMDGTIPYTVALYFCILVIFGSFFLLNIILAVILDSFTKVQEEEIKKIFLSDKKQLDKIYEQMEKEKSHHEYLDQQIQDNQQQNQESL